MGSTQTSSGFGQSIFTGSIHTKGKWRQLRNSSKFVDVNISIYLFILAPLIQSNSEVFGTEEAPLAETLYLNKTSHIQAREIQKLCPDSEFYRREMETDDNHATMRESFCLVQNTFFIDYFHMFPSHNSSGPPSVISGFVHSSSGQ